MRYQFNNVFGQYEVNTITKKKRTDIIVKSCLNKEMLLHHVRVLALENDCLNIYLTSKNNLVGSDISYTIDIYELTEKKETDSLFELVSLGINEINAFIEIINKSYFNIDSTPIYDNNDIIPLLNNDTIKLGFIKYQNKYIGSYLLNKNNIELFAIAKDYQGHHYAYKALSNLINEVIGPVSVSLSSRNQIALNLATKLGFIKSNKPAFNWYHME